MEKKVIGKISRFYMEEFQDARDKLYQEIKKSGFSQEQLLCILHQLVPSRKNQDFAKCPLLRLISYMYFQWMNFYGLYKRQKIKNYCHCELIFTMTIIFAKFPFQTSLLILIPSSKLVIHVSAYLIWCPYIIQKATIFNPLIFISKNHDLSWFLFSYNTYSDTAITTSCCSYCSGGSGGGWRRRHPHG